MKTLLYNPKGIFREFLPFMFSRIQKSKDNKKAPTSEMTEIEAHVNRYLTGLFYHLPYEICLSTAT